MEGEVKDSESELIQHELDIKQEASENKDKDMSEQKGETLQNESTYWEIESDSENSYYEIESSQFQKTICDFCSPMTGVTTLGPEPLILPLLLDYDEFYVCDIKDVLPEIIREIVFSLQYTFTKIFFFCN